MLAAHMAAASSPNGAKPRGVLSPCHSLPAASAVKWMDLFSPTCKMGSLIALLFLVTRFTSIHNRLHRRAQHLSVLLININIITKVSAGQVVPLEEIKHPSTQESAALLTPAPSPAAPPQRAGRPSRAARASSPAGSCRLHLPRGRARGRDQGLGHLTTLSGHLYLGKKRAEPMFFLSPLENQDSVLNFSQSTQKFFL